ncbi:uncharacterized protein LOC106872065 [Octopus bimaculoides]|uniref:uncharacterized protein LOC106872065 n=1 Tax=Octopus bimaculoides TaxID=37653 RepID=UPI00071E467A|nr:uncharacterized protein LOC106872065 [Octopus bimaculoides]|eukprot:XP_014774403.1 PREDICTED: uncharacterized protein LOC106872065 [Octopus bimaculoides]
MAASLVVLTKEEQRLVIRIIWSEGVKFIVWFQYKTGTAFYCIEVYKSIEEFKNGRTSTKYEDGTGRPSSSTIFMHIQQAQEIVLANRRVILNEVTCSLKISHGFAYEIIHDKLRFCSRARMVPRELTEAYKRNLVEVCQR